MTKIEINHQGDWVEVVEIKYHTPKKDYVVKEEGGFENILYIRIVEEEEVVEFKVGDRVADVVGNKGTVIKIMRGRERPIKVKFDKWGGWMLFTPEDLIGLYDLKCLEEEELEKNLVDLAGKVGKILRKERGEIEKLKIVNFKPFREDLKLYEITKKINELIEAVNKLQEDK